MLEDRGRCGWGAVVAAVTLFATLLLVTPAARATAAPGPGSVAVVVREHAGAGQGPERQVAALGGRVTRQLRIIDGFAATRPASAVERLRETDGVRSVTVDAGLRPQGGDQGWDDKKDGDEHAAAFAPVAGWTWP